MMGRVAALLVLISMVILLWMTFSPTGWSTMIFAFLGHPLLALGLILGFVALRRRMRRERAEVMQRLEMSLRPGPESERASVSQFSE